MRDKAEEVRDMKAEMHESFNMRRTTKDHGTVLTARKRPYTGENIYLNKNEMTVCIKILV